MFTNEVEMSEMLILAKGCLDELLEGEGRVEGNTIFFDFYDGSRFKLDLEKLPSMSEDEIKEFRSKKKTGRR